MPPVGPNDDERFGFDFADVPAGAGDLDGRAEPEAPGVFLEAMAKALTPPWANPRGESLPSLAGSEQSPPSVPTAARRGLCVKEEKRKLGCPAFEPEHSEPMLMTACCSTNGNALGLPVTLPKRDAS